MENREYKIRCLRDSAREFVGGFYELAGRRSLPSSPWGFRRVSRQGVRFLPTAKVTRHPLRHKLSPSTPSPTRESIALPSYASHRGQDGQLEIVGRVIYRRATL